VTDGESADDEMMN